MKMTIACNHSCTERESVGFVINSSSSRDGAVIVGFYDEDE